MWLYCVRMETAWRHFWGGDFQLRATQGHIRSQIVLFLIKFFFFTLRPASLLCKFIKALQTCICCWCWWLAFSRLLILAAAAAAALLNLRFENRCSLASTKVREKLVPKWTLSEQPAHWKPSGDAPRTVRSHPQSSSSPAEQARVRAWATPAAEMACTNAASRVPFFFLF